MALNKVGSPVKIVVEKTSAFALDINMLASVLEKKWPEKAISMEQLHEALKSLGVTNYQGDDMGELVSRLQAIGFKVTR